MSAHVDAVLADLTAKRDKLSEVIASLEWFKVEFPHTAAGLVATANGTGDTKLSKRSKPDRAVKRGRAATAETNGRLNETQERLLAALRKHHPVSPGELAAAVKLDVSGVRYHLKGLEKQGLVDFTGKTLDRQVHLTHKGGASKEHL